MSGRTNASNNSSSKRKRFEQGCRLMRTSLEHFISLTPGFKKSSYGEIQFKGSGSRSSYAPFVTCLDTATPQDVLRLFKEHWKLEYPNILISVHGEFPRRDYSWKSVMNEAMIFTTGSSPANQESYTSSTIAIIDINSVENKDIFYSKSNKGLFPAIYYTTKSKGVLKVLDKTHTHFLFVDGDSSASIADFRSKLISHIASIPIEMDDSATAFVTIPIISILVSDEMEALQTFSRDVEAGYPIIFGTSAHLVTDAVTEANTLNAELTDSNVRRIKRKSEAFVIGIEEKRNIINSLNKCALNEKNLRIYPSTKWTSLKSTILESLVESTRYSTRSCVRLSMVWNCMDTLKKLVYSSKQFQGDDNHMAVYLFVALALDRAEFLEYLHELGINIYSKLTIKMLWTLYYESLYNDQYTTETSFIIRRFVDNYVAKDASDLLSVIGRFISRLTKYEVNGLYSTREYFHPSCKQNAEGGKLCSCAVTIADDSHPVAHPDRDLFLWCVLLGKNNLAKVFWRNANNYAATALLASAILRGESELLEYNTQDSALAIELQESSQEWTQLSIDFIAASFRERKQTTLCLLTQRLVHYGGCSTLHLGYATECAEFIAQPAPQSALDYIWAGKTKKGHAGWKRCLALICPLLVPCLNIVDRTNHFLPSTSEIYQSTFSGVDPDIDDNNDREAGLGAGVVYVMQTISKQTGDGTFDLPVKQLGRCASFSEDIFDYFNSPSTKFLVHSMFLFANMITLSLVLVLRAPPYFSLSSTNLLTFLVLFYMIGISVDEIRQVMTQENQPSIRRRISSWLADGWNKIDLLMATCFFIGKAISFTHNPYIYLIKLFYSITLLFMAMRCFQIYLVFPFLGPKIYMMGKMMKDIRIFLSIMALIFFCYGVILESLDQELSEDREIVNTTAQFLILIYNNVLRDPYWQIYGEALGDATDEKFAFDTIVPAFITAFYVLFANLLMVNLLIAMFSYTFQTIQDNAQLYWKFNRFEVVREFWDRPWLPSPFIIIEDIVRTLQWFHNRSQQRNQAFNRALTKEQEEFLWDFEQEIQTLLTEKERGKSEEKNALHNDVKKILEKLEDENSQ